MQIEFLGTGTSTGVPMIGCSCEVCRSADPRDNRLRSSVCLTVGGKNILIDCGPDFRQQMLRSGINHIDAVLLTHEHYDHISGLDELRNFTRQMPIPVYAEPRVLQVVHDRFAYCFTDRPQPGIAHLSLHEISNLASFSLFGTEVVPLRVWHYRLPIVGYRVGAFAYITDMLSIDETECRKLADLDTLVVNALRHKPHLSHQNLESALAFISRIAPQRAYLTHMSHQMGLHAVEEPKLPTHVAFAYDGMVISVADGEDRPVRVMK